jgi:hypothetical protein
MLVYEQPEHVYLSPIRKAPANTSPGWPQNGQGTSGAMVCRFPRGYRRRFRLTRTTSPGAASRFRRSRCSSESGTHIRDCEPGQHGFVLRGSTTLHSPCNRLASSTACFRFILCAIVTQEANSRKTPSHSLASLRGVAFIRLATASTRSRKWLLSGKVSTTCRISSISRSFLLSRFFTCPFGSSPDALPALLLPVYKYLS